MVKLIEKRSTQISWKNLPKYERGEEERIEHNGVINCGSWKKRHKMNLIYRIADSKVA